jgi:hypothetical protein
MDIAVADTAITDVHEYVFWSGFTPLELKRLEWE